MDEMSHWQIINASNLTIDPDVVSQGDLLLLVEQTQGLLEVFLAALEGFIDVIGIALVGKRHYAVMGFEIVKDAVGKVINAHLLNLGKGKVNFAIGSHLLDVGGQAVADVDVLISFILVDLTPMCIVDNDTIAQVTGLHHQHLNSLAMVIVGIGLVQELSELSTGDDAMACRI